jgi:hypothetical protein
MATDGNSKPNFGPLQFSLRTLLLFVAFSAVLCSIGVCVSWIISIAVLFGVPLGILLTRFKEGIFVCGAQFFLIALMGCGFVSATAVGGEWQIEWWWQYGWWLTVIFAVLLGGFYGFWIVDAPQTRRRWLQVIPIALLLVFVMEGIEVRWQLQRQNYIQATIFKLGGRIGICGQSANRPMRVDLSGTKVTDDQVEYVKSVPNLREVRLDNTTITDRALKRLDGFGHLDFLSLDGTQITDVGLKYLKGHRLTTLLLNNTGITDAGLEHLEGMAELRCLELANTKITDAGLKHLERLSKLAYLVLEGTQITDAGLEHLKSLSRLSGLVLTRTKVTDAGLEHLKELTYLNELRLGQTQVTGAGLIHLKEVGRWYGDGHTDMFFTLHLEDTPFTDAGLKNLEGSQQRLRLYLERTQVTDEGLEHLQGLDLMDIYLAGTKVTDAGAAKLERALPTCGINR